MAPRRPWLAAAGLVYVAVWVAGLLIAPAAPEGAQLAAFYRTNRLALLAQALLVHGVAAVAVVALATALAQAARGTAPLAARLGWGAAALAGGLSLVQAALGVAMVSPATLAGDAAALPLLRAQIDALDLAKLLALALFVGASLPLARRGGRCRAGWVGRGSCWRLPSSLAA